MCGLTIRPSLYTTLLGRNQLRKSGGVGSGERTKETKKVEHDFVLNVSLSFVSS